MNFEWDEAKRLKNIERHGIDFRFAVHLFAGPLVVEDARTVADERRLMATGRIGDVCVTAVYTMRNGVTRLISMRRARRGERARYQKVYGG